VRRLELAKQAADLHTSQLTQMVVHEVIKDGFLEQHIPKIRSLYGNQCQVMLDGHGEHFPAGVSGPSRKAACSSGSPCPSTSTPCSCWTKPSPTRWPSCQAPFYANTPDTHTLRLSFVTVPPERIQGIAILGKLIAAKSDAPPPRPALRAFPAPAVAGHASFPLKTVYTATTSCIYF
jgi:2-aminoadipate transaminase